MRIDGQEQVKAPQAAVWAVLGDPAVLARCVPGCKAMQAVGENQYSIDMELGLAAIKGRYTGTVSMTAQQAPDFLRLRVEAKGSPGWMTGLWDVHLRSAGEAVSITYAGEAQVGGLIAGVGQRVLGGVAKIIMGEFFKALAREVTQRREVAG